MEHQLMGPNLTQAEGFVLAGGAPWHLTTAATRSGRLFCYQQDLPSLPSARPVIVYGVSASVVYGLIYWNTTLF